jgi:serine/threonine-protein kinase
VPVASFDPLAERSALALFEAALDVGAADRAAWLRERCGDDAALIARVQRLLDLDAEDASSHFGGAAGDTQLASNAPWAAVRPPTQVGPYRLDELVGSGGMGAVYRASRSDGLFDQTVAIKFVRPLRGIGAVEPLVDAERRLLARMQHPGIAHILDGGTTASGLHFLVMEFVDGVALDEHVAEQRLDARRIVGLLREVCAAVAHAHQHLVLHCDIKPANVLVTAEQRPKLIDFGVARIQDVIDASLPQGYTRAYASPQRLAGEPATMADDVYSLGCVLAELLGDPPPEGTAPTATSADEELAAVIRKATAADRADRYASVRAFDEDLTAWLARRPVTALPDHWRYRTRKLVQRHPWQSAAAALAVAGVATALVVISLLYGRAETARRDAEKRFDEVRALATYLLFDLDTRLEAVPGTTAARREMVGRSQQYLDALAASAKDQPELQREVAVGLARLAEVQGVPGRPHVGEPAAAKANLERAERILLALAAAPGRVVAPDARAARDLGQVRYLLALIYGGRDNDPARQLSKAREAEQQIQLALDAMQASPRPAGLVPAATAAPASSPEPRRAASGSTLAGPPRLADLHVLLTSTRLTQADALRSLDRHAEAAALQGGEEQRLFALPEALRAQMDFDYQSGRPALMFGDSLYYLERKPEALEAYRRASDRFERGLARTPLDRRLLIAATMGRWYVSSVLAELDQPDEALRQSDRALQIAAQMLAIDPENLEALRMRNAVLGDRAFVLSKLGRWDEAIALIEGSLPEKQARANRAPEDSERARDVAVPLRLLASYYDGKGDRIGACRVYRRALEAWTGIERRWGLGDFDRRGELDVVRAAAGRCD